MVSTTRHDEEYSAEEETCANEEPESPHENLKDALRFILEEDPVNP